MKLSMLADFKILKKNADGVFVPMTNKEARSVSIGGFSFDVDGHSIPFDWDAFTGSEHDKVFEFATGRGWAFNDFELADYYDKDYADMGLSRETLSAEYLASVHHIEEFFVNFEDGDKEVGVGFFADNKDKEAAYKLELIEISFEDIETGKYYDVKPEVLTAFNKGERGKLSLTEQIDISAAEMVEMLENGTLKTKQKSRQFTNDLDEQIAFASNAKEYELTFFQGELNEKRIRIMLTDEQAGMICKKIGGDLQGKHNITLADGCVLNVDSIDAIEILDGDSLIPERQATHTDKER